MPCVKPFLANNHLSSSSITPQAHGNLYDRLLVQAEPAVPAPTDRSSERSPDAVHYVNAPSRRTPEVRACVHACQSGGWSPLNPVG